MSLFQNGRQYNLAVRCPPPSGYHLPVVEIELAGASGVFVPVVGKTDSGAFRTMLTFDTAGALGIGDPTSSPETGTARTATDDPFPYYVHRIMVKIGKANEQHILFPSRAAFAEKVQRNLFGVDWLGHLSLAVDRQAVHFLKD